MTAYVIAEIDVTDRDAYKIYETAGADSVARHGGRFLARGGRSAGLEGPAPKRIMVIEFATMEAAQRWHDSPDYRDARAIRAIAGKSRLVIVDGAPAT
jgi:uncharacterized protein (DUF1330 family)